ncbi:alpha/beta hydrolase [Cupriavidus sp. CP313]
MLSGEASCVGAGSTPASMPGAVGRVYKTASGRDLRVHVLEPADTSAHRPAILFFFGGGWRRGQVDQFLGQAKAAAGRGYVSVLADYRVACRDKTNAIAAVEDARDAYAWLRRESAGLGVDPGRIVLAGGSAGGQLALVASLSVTGAALPAALVLYNPAVDLVPMGSWIGLRPDEAAAISPSAMNVAASPPMLIFHGDADRIVPIGTVREFCRKVTSAAGRCELHEYAGQGHGFFNSRAKDARGLAPYDDTLARTFAFLDGLGLQPSR